MKLIELVEARRNPEQNQKASVLDRLKWIYAQHGDAYVTFTKVDKLGINPRSDYNTPLGIYAYPIKYVIDEEGDVPFAGNNPYIQVFLPPSEGLWVMDKFDKAVTHHLLAGLDKLGIKPSPQLINATQTNKQWYGLYDSCYAHLHDEPDWGGFEKYHDEEDGGSGDPRLSMLVRKVLMASGYRGVVDPGNGIMHINEENQAVFFIKSDLKHIDVIRNINSDLISSIKKYKVGQVWPTLVSTLFFGSFDGISDRIPAIEQHVLHYPMATIPRHYIYSVFPKGWPAYERVLASQKDIPAILAYCRMMNRIPSELETILISNVTDNNVKEMAALACTVMRKRWPKLEPILFKWYKQVWLIYCEKFGIPPTEKIV
jgi:hypothetical protein